LKDAYAFDGGDMLTARYEEGGAGTYEYDGVTWRKASYTMDAQGNVKVVTYNTTISAANLYADHSASSRLIKTVNQGERVAIRNITSGMTTTLVSFTDSAGKTWYQVEHGGSEGWISEDHFSSK